MASGALELVKSGTSSLARSWSNYQASTSRSHSTLPQAQKSSASQSNFLGRGIVTPSPLQKSCQRTSSGTRFSTHDRLGVKASASQRCQPSSSQFLRSRTEFGGLLCGLKDRRRGLDTRQRKNVRAAAVSGGATAQGDNAAPVSKKNLLPVEVELSWQPPK